MHRLGDEVLAEHGAERAAAVATAGKDGGSGAFGVEIAAVDLTEQQGAPVAELRGELAELVAGVAHGDGAVAAAAEEELDALGAAEPVGVESEVAGEVVVEHHELRVGLLLGAGCVDELGEGVGVAVVELGCVHDSRVRT